MSEKLKMSVLSVPNVTTTRFSEKVMNTNDYVSYGADNKFPDYLWQKYTDCATHQAIINGKVDYILGNGLTDGDKIVNSKGETLYEVVKKIALDQQIFGGYAIQVVYNRGGEIADIYWADFTKLRLSKSEKQVYWCDDWNGYQAEPIAYDLFNPEMTNKTTQILYCRASTCRSFYPMPSYTAALEAIETEIKIQNYHLNNLTNGFSASTLINMNGGIPTKDERDDFEERLNAKYSGADNAGKLIISWNKNKETACSVEKLEDDNFDKKFAQLAKDTQRNIFISHRVTSPCLFGVVPENTGFSKQEYEEAFEVFNRTIIKPYQDDLSIQLRKVLNKDIVFEVFSLTSSKSE